MSTINMGFPGKNVASILSDAAFCVYRLNMLNSKPNPDNTAIAAIVSRIKRLAAAYPEVILPDDRIRGVYNGVGPSYEGLR